MKTLTLDKQLAEKVENLAKEMRVSSKQLISLALEDFLGRQQNKQIFEAINEACEGLPNSEEKQDLEITKTYAKTILDEWK